MTLNFARSAATYHHQQRLDSLGGATWDAANNRLWIGHHWAGNNAADSGGYHLLEAFELTNPDAPSPLWPFAAMAAVWTVGGLIGRRV